MICHSCQKNKPLSKGCVYVSDNQKYWACNNCITSMERVTELETVLKKVRDRLHQLSQDSLNEPWVARVANEAFRPSFDGVKQAVYDVDMILWRRTD
jgi:hypothetical protein